MNAGKTLTTVGWFISLPCVGSQLTVSRLVFLVSVAGWLRAYRSSLCRQPGSCKLASLPCVGWQCTARRFAVAVCTPDNLSQCKRSCDYHLGGPHLYTLSLAAPDPMGIGAAIVRIDWLALAVMWEAPTPPFLYSIERWSVIYIHSVFFLLFIVVVL
jgi:hypothetical protein